jgi:hypothetical protein
MALLWCDWLTIVPVLPNSIGRALVSRDGRYVIFDSNVNLKNAHLSKYSDVYMIRVR